MMNVTYPEIKGAEAINGFVGYSKKVYVINVGETVDVDDADISHLLTTYSFLKKEGNKAVVTEPKKSTTEVVDFKNLDWQELLKVAKEQGIYKAKMKKHDILKILGKKN